MRECLLSRSHLPQQQDFYQRFANISCGISRIGRHSHGNTVIQCKGFLVCCNVARQCINNFNCRGSRKTILWLIDSLHSWSTSRYIHLCLTVLAHYTLVWTTVIAFLKQISFSFILHPTSSSPFKSDTYLNTNTHLNTLIHNVRDKCLLVFVIELLTAGRFMTLLLLMTVFTWT